MAKLTDLTIGVGLKVDESTAQACLKLVQMYVNQTGRNVIVQRYENGEFSFEFESPDIERDMLKFDNESLKQEKELLLNTIEKLEDEIQRLERELNEKQIEKDI